MPWTPDATVTIGGTDYSGAALEGATVTRGRSDVYSQPSAGYATVVVLTTTGQALQPDLGVELTVDLDDSAGTPVRLFTGTVQSWSSTPSPGGETDVIATTVTAVGPLAKMARRTVAATRAEETDGARVAWAIEQGLGVLWETWTPATDTWADVDPALTWGGVPPELDDIDTGIYDVAALTSGDQASTYTIAAEAAGSGQGILYETAGGVVGFANEARRATNAATPLELDSGEVGIDVSVRSDAANLANHVTVVYASGEVTGDENVSVGIYGRYSAVIQTTLADVSAATNVAARYLERHAYPAQALDVLTLRLDTGNLADALIDDVLELETNDALEVTTLPAGLGDPQLVVIVEGVRWNLGRRTEVVLNVSPVFLSVGPSLWGTVAATLAWAEVPTTLTWEDARSL